MTFEELEQIRENYHQKRKDCYIKVGTVVGTVFSIIFLYTLIGGLVDSSKSNPADLVLLNFLPLVIQFSVIGLIAAVIYVNIKTNADAKAYKNAYKYFFITSTFEKVFTDLVYRHDVGMPYQTPASTGMIRMGDRYSSNDYTIAKYKGIPFEQADVHIEEEHTDSDGDRTYVTIFRGRYITFDLKKDFSKKLLVASKNFNAEKHDKTFKRTELESTEFNKKFVTYAQDGFEAYYLLDPAVMERIMKLDELHNGKIMVCFSDSKMHIAINNHIDSFEPAKASKPIDEQAEFNKVINDIKVITNIIDEVRLAK